MWEVVFTSLRRFSFFTSLVADFAIIPDLKVEIHGERADQIGYRGLQTPILNEVNKIARAQAPATISLYKMIKSLNATGANSHHTDHIVYLTYAKNSRSKKCPVSSKWKQKRLTV
jgi:hypothetical protein